VVISSFDRPPQPGIEGLWRTRTRRVEGVAVADEPALVGNTQHDDVRVAVGCVESLEERRHIVVQYRGYASVSRLRVVQPSIVPSPTGGILSQAACSITARRHHAAQPVPAGDRRRAAGRVRRPPFTPQRRPRTAAVGEFRISPTYAMFGMRTRHAYRAIRRPDEKPSLPFILRPPTPVPSGDTWDDIQVITEATVGAASYAALPSPRSTDIRGTEATNGSETASCPQCDRAAYYASSQFESLGPSGRRRLITASCHGIARRAKPEADWRESKDLVQPLNQTQSETRAFNAKAQRRKEDFFRPLLSLQQKHLRRSRHDSASSFRRCWGIRHNRVRRPGQPTIDE